MFTIKYAVFRTLGWEYFPKISVNSKSRHSHQCELNVHSMSTLVSSKLVYLLRFRSPWCHYFLCLSYAAEKKSLSWGSPYPPFVELV